MTASYGSPLFNVTDGATLTFVGDGSIENRSCVGIATNDAKIIVENGTFVSTAKEPFRAGENGTVIVEDGTLTGQEGAVVSNNPNGTIIINGGLLEGLDNFAVATNGTAGRGGNYIEINGGKLIGNIRSPGYEAIGVYIANYDTFVMNGGEIIANGGTGICLRAGSATINDGIVTATGVDKDGNPVADGWIGDKKLVMDGIAAIIYHKSANYPANEDLNLTINGGVITGVDYSVQVLSEEETPAVFINGGTLTPPYPLPVTETNEPELEPEPEVEPEPEQP